MRLALLLSVVLAVPAFADVPSGPELSMLDGGLALVTPDVVAPAPAPSLDNPTAFLHVIFAAVKDGDWWGAASALLVLIVSLLRVYGKKLHAWIPDESIWDKPLWFVFDTKAGGYLLNICTAIAGGVGTALLAGEPVTWALVKPIVMVSVTATALWEIAKDVYEMIKKKAVPAPAEPPKP